MRNFSELYKSANNDALDTVKANVGMAEKGKRLNCI